MNEVEFPSSRRSSTEAEQAGAAVMIVSGIFALAAVALLWYLFDVLLLVFAAILLAMVIAPRPNGCPGTCTFRSAGHWASFFYSHCSFWPALDGCSAQP